MRSAAPVEPFCRYLRGEPLPIAYALVGLLLFGAAGAIAGLLRGLEIHPATAWFAVFEIGMPAAIVGAAIGSIVGLLALGIAKLRQH